MAKNKRNTREIKRKIKTNKFAERVHAQYYAMCASQVRFVSVKDFNPRPKREIAQSKKPTTNNAIHNNLPLVSSNNLRRLVSVPQMDIKKYITLGKTINMELGEIYTPGNFYLKLRDESFTALSSNMQVYFSQNANKIIVPPEMILKGYCCATLYNGKYCRAKIFNVHTNIEKHVQVLLMDGGALKIVSCNELWYLPMKFVKLPSQIISTRLSNIYASSKDRQWSMKCNNLFYELIKKENVFAKAMKITKTKVLEVLLESKVNNLTFYINDFLVAAGFAFYSNGLVTMQHTFQNIVTGNVKNQLQIQEVSDTDQQNNELGGNGTSNEPQDNFIDLTLFPVRSSMANVRQSDEVIDVDAIEDVEITNNTTLVPSIRSVSNDLNVSIVKEDYVNYATITEAERNSRLYKWMLFVGSNTNHNVSNNY